MRISDWSSDVCSSDLFASAKIAARRLPMRTWFAVTLLMSTLPVAAQAAEITVDMQEADYSPAMVDAQVGDRILFVNDDVVDHEVFVPTAGHGVDLGKQAPGAQSVLPRSEEHTSELQSLMD